MSTPKVPALPVPAIGLAGPMAFARHKTVLRTVLCPGSAPRRGRTRTMNSACGLFIACEGLAACLPEGARNLGAARRFLVSA
jgi:hypothetical protein